eukprot:1883371-Ditylum_brightwellii.AAC.1
MTAMTAVNNQHLFSLQTQNRLMMTQMQQTYSQQISQLQQTTGQQSQQIQRIEDLLANLGVGESYLNLLTAPHPNQWRVMVQWNHE